MKCKLFPLLAVLCVLKPPAHSSQSHKLAIRGSDPPFVTPGAACAAAVSVGAVVSFWANRAPVHIAVVASLVNPPLTTHLTTTFATTNNAN